jgi:nucleotide-binding universal stress UspA family protein
MQLLVGIDLSDSTDQVVKEAERFATALSARVWLLHVVQPESADLYGAGYEPDTIGLEPDPQALRDALAKRFRAEHRQTQEIAGRLRAAGLETTALLMQGATIETILREASRLAVDMIIVGSHGQGALHQLLVGSVSEGILRKSARPVLIVPALKRD